MDYLKTFSQRLAKEISEKQIFDIEGISLLIEIRIKSSLLDIVEEYSHKENKEYEKLLEKQSNTKINSIKYIEIGYELARQKIKKANANNIVHDMQKTHKYTLLKDFICEKFGKNVLDEFSKTINKQI